MDTDSIYKLQNKLLTRFKEMASMLAEEGCLFNKHLVNQFDGWKSISLESMGHLTDIPEEHLVFYKAVAQTLGWIQQDEATNLPVIYLRILLEARHGEISGSKVKERLEEMLEKAHKERQVKKPRSLFGVVAGLRTWSEVKLPDTEVIDLGMVQRRALNVGGRARWTALAPLKMYALHKGLSTATPKEIYPPMGSAVSRGIKQLFGFPLGESEGDYELSMELHLKLADLANTSIWDINSGFYLLGGGS